MKQLIAKENHSELKSNSIESLSLKDLKCSDQKNLLQRSKSSDKENFHDAYLASNLVIIPSEVTLKIINQEGRKRKFRVNVRQKMEKSVRSTNNNLDYKIYEML